MSFTLVVGVLEQSKATVVLRAVYYDTGVPQFLLTIFVAILILWMLLKKKN